MGDAWPLIRPVVAPAHDGEDAAQFKECARVAHDASLIECETVTNHDKEPSMPDAPDDAWAARKIAQATAPLTDDERDRVALYDALLAGFRVTVAGIDVTRWHPALPAELQKKAAPEPKPERQRAGNRARRSSKRKGR